MSSKTISIKIIHEYCPPNDGGRKVTVLKDSNGVIGGYIINLPVLDTPISFLDADGKFLASFDIFGTDEEKEEDSKIINDLIKRFPIQEPLVCPS